MLTVAYLHMQHKFESCVCVTQSIRVQLVGNISQAVRSFHLLAADLVCLLFGADQVVLSVFIKTSVTENSSLPQLETRLAKGTELKL